ncbi:hypothetical protein CRG98_000744 [Punica granatum]|uniref:Uncharacterized protein n=1 Tax=Punica granatum TaxID=22663 RepID=A0A2I0LDY1_PUNGR|nr:hypothetical protein CRG98_000744 [Punica granatum]
MLLLRLNKVDPRFRDLLSRLNVLQPRELNRVVMLNRVRANSTPLCQLLPLTYSGSFFPTTRSEQRRLVPTLTPQSKIKTCAVTLHNKIEEMIDTRQISFIEVKPSNVRTNPFLDHGSGSGPSVNMISIVAIEEEEDAQQTSIPFVINYAPAEVAFAAVPFVIEVLAKEPYQESRVPLTYEGRVYQGPNPADKGKAPATAFSAVPEAVPLPTKRSPIRKSKFS